MADLSPAAQAIINAAVVAGGGYGRATPVLHARLAAALRAAADQLGYNIVYDDHDKDYMVDVADLLAIAAELEGAQ